MTSEATADVYDRLGEALDSSSLPWRTYGGRPAFSGPATTVRCFRDNALVKELLNTPGQGRVLVVDGGGSIESALCGDLIAKAATDNGWAGIVINGAVRDTQVLSTLDIGVVALGSNPRKSAKDGAGQVDVPVTFGGATFSPGATVWADPDGVLVERG
ncbi:ribonuclease E activity regulator RraA [Branchiibius cervicis]|uniref:4-hydroxy-4-methyl-2-oxoglutarate aldolase n=1 Tax=Branchiibius cervicis TaxID=908252 RepID=A0ABW2ASB7_9MICO